VKSRQYETRFYKKPVVALADSMFIADVVAQVRPTEEDGGAKFALVLTALLPLVEVCHRLLERPHVI
jgi:hypothetical protein